MATPEELAEKYGTGSQVTLKPGVAPAEEPAAKSIDDLYNKYTSNASPVAVIPPVNIEQGLEFNRGLKQGAKDVATTIGDVAVKGGQLAEKAGVPTDIARNPGIEADLARLKSERDEFEKTAGISGNTGRVIGQIGVTAPLLPVRGMEAINTGLRATPNVTAAGTKMAAPLINRLGASVVTGGITGAEYGALTSGSNERGLVSNSTEGLITGALAGPVIAAGGGTLNKLAEKSLNSWSNLRVDRIVNQTGMPASAVKNIIQRLEAAGFTPITAQQELTRLGPKATLADLDASLTAEARGLATLGDKPTSILKGIYADRASKAGDETNKIVNQQLGPHVNLEQEKENIVKAAQKAVDPDYKVAHASKQVLDAQPIIDNIDKSLQTAVGSKASRLAEVKSYLYRKFKKPNGDEETIPRFNIEDLHETRIGIDGLLNKMQQEGDSQTSATYRAVEKVRNEVDALLKQNHEMKVADEKFAAEMNKKDALQAGYDVIKKNLTTDQFNKQFIGQPPEIQDAFKKGMRAYIGDYLETGTQGEANAAQRLFSKKASNRGNLEQAFGNNAKGALDALEREEAFRTTEKAVRYGSDTAQNLSVQERYKPQQGAASIAGEAAKGMVLDVVTGTPAVGAVTYASKRAGGNALIKLSEDRAAQLAEGTADILSRSDQSAQNALRVAARVNKIQQKIAKTQPKLQLPSLKLPAVLSGPVGQEGYEAYQKYK